MKFIGTKTLETDRLLLRRLTVKDAPIAYQNWCSSDVVPKYVFWSKHDSVDATKKLFQLWENDYADPSTYRWIVEVKATNELVGIIDVASKKFLPFGVCEIGYCYGEKFWGNGYASEALKEVIAFLFEECDAITIFAQHMSNNPASGKVMQKVGMTFEGILRNRIIDKDGFRNDIASYSITREEYERLR